VETEVSFESICIWIQVMVNLTLSLHLDFLYFSFMVTLRITFCVDQILRVT
jgi:hypothetical protein